MFSIIIVTWSSVLTTVIIYARTFPHVSNHTLSLLQLSHMCIYICSHYAAKLDGCGLDLENEVRKAYHLLLQRLIEGLAAYSRSTSPLVHYINYTSLDNIMM